MSLSKVIMSQYCDILYYYFYLLVHNLLLKYVLHSCSIASSSGVSSSSGTVLKKLSLPGPIDNRNLVAESNLKVPTLTGEGKPRMTDLIT